MGIEYREYQRTDFLQFATISNDDWKGTHIRVAYSLSKRNEKIELCYVALDGKNIVGYIYGFALPSKTLIPEFMYVKPELRRKGIGEALLTMLEQKSGCDCSMIFYHKSLHNHYQKLGYETGDNLETAMKQIALGETAQ